MKYFSIGKFSEAIEVTVQTLRNWDETSRLKPHYLGNTGYWYYSQQQLQLYLGLKGEVQELVEDLVQIITVFSCRLQGKIANKTKKMIKELLDDDDDISSEG